MTVVGRHDVALSRFAVSSLNFKLLSAGRIVSTTFGVTASRFEFDCNRQTHSQSSTMQNDSEPGWIMR